MLVPKFSRFILAVCIFLLSGCAKNRSLSDTNDLGINGLAIALETNQQSYRVGEAISITIILKNTSNKDLTVNNRFNLGSTNESSQYRDTALIIKDAGGKQISFALFVMSLALSSNDYTDLPANGTIRHTYKDITNFYDLSKSGQYSIQGYYENEADFGDPISTWKGKIFTNVVNIRVNK